jgi:hypothetical protein
VNSQVGMQEQKVELLHISDVFVAHRGSFMGAAECIKREREQSIYRVGFCVKKEAAEQRMESETPGVS